MGLFRNIFGTTCSFFKIGSVYTEPTLDNHAVPKKYMDEQLGNHTHNNSLIERFVTGSVNANINDVLNISGDCEITLPTANIGDSFYITDVDMAFDANDVKILQASGIAINGIENEDFQFDIKNVSVQVKKVSVTNWRVF